MKLIIRPPNKWGKPSLQLPLSKSYSTRLVALSFLSGGRVVPGRLSEGDDVNAFQRLLEAIQKGNTKMVLLKAGEGAAVARFGMAIAAVSPGEYYLDGSPQLRKRPMGMLAEALQGLGADIRYAGQAGFLPLIIRGKQLHGGQISLSASESSQYASALALIGSTLSEPLLLHLQGAPVSLPYLDLSLSLLRASGIPAEREGSLIEIHPGSFRHIKLDAPPDWSAAAFIYAMVCLSDMAGILLPGIHPDTLQADAEAIHFFHLLGVETIVSKGGIQLQKHPIPGKGLEVNLRHCPDLLPALAVSAAGIGIEAFFTGLAHLPLKESDRIHSIQAGLEKAGIKTDGGSDWLRIYPGLVRTKLLHIDSFGDHRIAMAFSLLSLKSGAVCIQQAECVKKSWPAWWDMLKALGFEINEY